jgi:hypothetical protein
MRVVVIIIIIIIIICSTHHHQLGHQPLTRTMISKHCVLFAGGCCQLVELCLHHECHCHPSLSNGGPRHIGHQTKHVAVGGCPSSFIHSSSTCQRIGLFAPLRARTNGHHVAGHQSESVGAGVGETTRISERGELLFHLVIETPDLLICQILWMCCFNGQPAHSVPCKMFLKMHAQRRAANYVCPDVHHPKSAAVCPT